MTNDQKQKTQQMRDEGQSYLQISLVLGISENTVKSFCRRNNLGTVRSRNNKAAIEPQNICKHCGKSLLLIKKSQYQKFCSEDCRRFWWKANSDQLAKKAWYSFFCAGCGREFKSYGNQKRKFCGHACYIARRFGKEGDVNDTRAV